MAVAPAFCVDEVLARREPAQLDVAALSGELGRFDDAVQAAAVELDAIVERVSRQVGEEEAAIFRAHRLLLRDPALVGKASEHLAGIYQAKGTWEEAEALYREALNTYRMLGDEPGMADIYTHVGTLYASLRRFDKAQAMYRDALSIHQRLGDKAGMAVDYAYLGAVYTARGRFDHGEAMYHEALKLNDALDRKPSLALVYADLGRLYHRRGKAQQAEHMYRQALAIDAALNYQPGMASHYSHLASLSRQAGDLHQAAALNVKLLRPARWRSAFRHHHKAVVPRRPRHFDPLAHRPNVERNLRDQDHIRSASHARCQRQPAAVAPHHFHHHHAVVALGGRLQLVQRLGRRQNRRIEAERHVRLAQVVVNRLRHAHDFSA